MDKTILAIIRMVLEFGPDIVIDIAKLWNPDRPTPEQIRAIKIVKKPEDYLNE